MRPAIRPKIATSITTVAEAEIGMGGSTSARGIRTDKHTPVGNSCILRVPPFRLRELEQHIHQVVSGIRLPRQPEPTCTYWI